MARVGILIKHTDGNHDLENVQISLLSIVYMVSKKNLELMTFLSLVQSV